MLRCQDLTLPLPEFTLRISLELHADAVGIVGPSGAGKTTLLELIAGLKQPARGRIELGERVLFDAASQTCVPPREREIGYVTQDDTIFPHMTVLQNLRFGRRHEVDLRREENTIKVLGLDSILRRRPDQLSGGERRRVAIGRAMISDPGLLLLDEPLTGLDPALRDQVLRHLRDIQATFGTPMLMVSHHEDEVRQLCSEVVTIDRGALVEKSGASTSLEKAGFEAPRI